MVIVGILAGVSVPAFNSVSDTRQVAATRRVQADLAWARQYAVATGRRTWVVFDEVAESWSLLAELPSNPGRANAVALSDPGTGGTWTGAADGNGLFDVEIITAEFDGADEIGFDWIGRPLNAAETDLAAEGVVTLTGGHQVTVAAESGLVRFVP